MEKAKPASVAARLIAALLFVIGTTIAFGGAWLVSLSGSIYYLVGGIVVVIAAILVWRGDRRGALLYAAFLLATLLWGVWETGLDGWALAPRLIGPAVWAII